ncbi:MAG: DNA gyrase C-terminal beta-propeller domain-containing protein, partial [Chloroflexota bacterium]
HTAGRRSTRAARVVADTAWAAAAAAPLATTTSIAISGSVRADGGRGGNGVMTFRVTPRSGPLTVARAVSADHELVVVSKNGIVMRTSAGSISQQGRGTQGVQVMNVDDDDVVASVARVDLAEGPDVTAEE